MPDTFHISSCPVCAHSQFRLVLKAKDHLVSKQSFSILECVNCDFRFTQDPPSPSAIGPYYDDEAYVEHSDSQSGLIFNLYHRARRIMLSFKYRMLKKRSNGKRLLDVGSASGYFMEYMQSKGYDAQGIEISDKARELCKQRCGIEAFEPKSLINNELNGKYDLITLWHVFEHVYTYDDYFKAFARYINDGGTLAIAMPNHRCLDETYYGKYWCAYDVPRHLWHFEQKTFKAFAEKRGFKLAAVKRLPLDPFYNAMVSASYKKGFKFLPWTMYIGCLSFVMGLFNKKKASSLVYLLNKTN